MLYPLTFAPIFKERVWGGRRLEELFRKPLPPGVPIGESWEISDRPGDISVSTNGPLAGSTLNQLVERQGDGLLGESPTAHGRFPLLIKILDAREKLSLQVHPPAPLAAAMGGEPKTEMWYVAQAQPGACLYVGLRRGVTREEFARKMESGTVEECFHRIPVQAGDAMFLPSGRVHAIGGGLVIFEIQQNSDTTYRVFDWNRVGLDGKPRDLHVKESMACIDFADFEPALIPGASIPAGPGRLRPLVRNPLFDVDALELPANAETVLGPGRAQILGVLSGKVTLKWTGSSLELKPGKFCLVPAVHAGVKLAAGASGAAWLRASPGPAAGAQPPRKSSTP